MIPKVGLLVAIFLAGLCFSVGLASDQNDCDDNCSDYYRNCNPPAGLTKDKDEEIDCQKDNFKLRCPLTCKVCKKCDSSLEDQVEVLKKEISMLEEQLLRGCIDGLRDCQNGGSCGKDGKCLCPDTYRGDFCETKNTFKWTEYTTEEQANDDEYIASRKCQRDDGVSADASNCGGGRVKLHLKYFSNQKTQTQADTDCKDKGYILWGNLEGVTRDTLKSIIDTVNVGSHDRFHMGISKVNNKWVNMENKDVGVDIQPLWGPKIEPSNYENIVAWLVKKNNVDYGMFDYNGTRKYPYFCEVQN